jgi:predicted Zn-dependent peptidase
MAEKLNYISENLNNGIRLNTLKTNCFKTNLLTFNIITPLREETASEFSLLTDVLTAACEKYPSLVELGKKMADLYSASVNAFVQKRGENQIVVFELSLINNEYAYDGTDLFDEGTKLLSQVMLHPYLKNGLFDEEIVEREKKNLTDSMREKINNKASYANDRCTEIMCEGEPFALDANGTIERVEAATPKTLMEAYRKLLSDYPIEIFYAGTMAHEDVKKYIQQNISLPQGDRNIVSKAIIKGAGEIKTVEESFDVSQGKLILGFKSNHTPKNIEELLAIQLFCDIFGASPTSKLFMNVREKLSLCYYCRPIYTALKGVMLVSSGIETSNFEKAKSAILAELDAMKTGDISEEELDNGKKSLINSFKMVTDSLGGIISWGSVRRLYTDGKIATPEDFAEKVNDITKEQIVEVANRLILDTVYLLKGGEN